MYEARSSFAPAPVDHMQRRSKSIAAERAHERRIDLRVPFEMMRDAGAAFDLAQKIAERRRAKAMQVLDEAAAASHR